MPICSKCGKNFSGTKCPYCNTIIGKEDLQKFGEAERGPDDAGL